MLFVSWSITSCLLYCSTVCTPFLYLPSCFSKSCHEPSSLLFSLLVSPHSPIPSYKSLLFCLSLLHRRQAALSLSRVSLPKYSTHPVANLMHFLDLILIWTDLNLIQILTLDTDYWALQRKKSSGTEIPGWYRLCAGSIIRYPLYLKCRHCINSNFQRPHTDKMQFIFSSAKSHYIFSFYSKE